MARGRKPREREHCNGESIIRQKAIFGKILNKIQKT